MSNYLNKNSSDSFNQLLQESPFKGLSPYDEGDGYLFFGREKEVRNIVQNLQLWRLTILYGQSGTGKSSLLRAGVADLLQQEAENSIRDLDCLNKLAIAVFPPLNDESSQTQELSLTERLLNQIELKLKKIHKIRKEVEERENITNTSSNGLRSWGEIYGDKEEEIEDLYYEDYQGSRSKFVRVLREWTEWLRSGKRRGKLLIILDQLEEWFPENPQKEEFISDLAEALNESSLFVNFLIAIRSNSITLLDCLKGCLKGYRQDPLSRRLEIKYLEETKAKSAILNAIEAYQKKHNNRVFIDIEERFLDDILTAVAIKEDPDFINTSYLQLVMSFLWEQEIINLMEKQL